MVVTSCNNDISEHTNKLYILRTKITTRLENCNIQSIKTAQLKEAKGNSASGLLVANTMLGEFLPFIWQFHLLKGMVMLETVYQLLDAVPSQWVVTEVQHQKTLVHKQCFGQIATPSIVNVVSWDIQLSECNVGVKRLCKQLCTLMANLIVTQLQHFQTLVHI